MEVMQISPEDTYEIRHKVLRIGKPIESCHYDGDFDDNTFHLGAFVDKTLSSVASFYLKNHPKIEDEYQYQLRGMATLQEMRGKGLSKALLQTGFPMIQKNHIDVVWCNARTEAIGFYKKVGFEIVGEEFEIPDVGPHYLMKLRLES